jgi:23S rRNA (adenine2030-N6)-methyltransferase
MSERYAASAERPDYSHRFHAGNVGDVWKHAVWIALVRELQRTSSHVDIIDCHGGHGAYDLGSTGEWTAGIGLLLEKNQTGEVGAVGEYLDLVTRFGHDRIRLQRYPGSPIILSALLRTEDTLTCCEIDPAAHADLAKTAEMYRFTARAGDGLSTLRSGADSGEGNRHQLYLIDPPWNVKADWQTIPRAIIEGAAHSRSRCVALWYPIKSYTRVNAMIKELRAAGLHCLVGELITTPLDLRHNRLNGSGVCIVSPPPLLERALAPLGAEIGGACATHRGYYELHLRGWDS